MYAFTGSSAETYARNHGIRFMSMGVIPTQYLDLPEKIADMTESAETTEVITEATEPPETSEVSDEVTEPTEPTEPTTETVTEQPAEPTEASTKTSDVPNKETEAETSEKKKDDIYYKDESLDVSLPPENEKITE